MCVKLLGDVGKKKFTKEFFLDLPEEAREKKKKRKIGFTVMMHFF